MQLQQQDDAIQQTHQQIVALKTWYDEQQHHMQLQHSEVRQSAATVFMLKHEFSCCPEAADSKPVLLTACSFTAVRM